MKTDVLIIGGGMAGLRLAQLLSKSGVAFHLVEARDRLGGRMLTERVNGGTFDMGPAWFWPGQPRIAELAASHGIGVFEQYADGDLVYEDERGGVAKHNFSSMAGSLRLDAGFGALIHAMATSLPGGKISLSCPVSDLIRGGEDIIAKTPRSDIVAKCVALAVPPRLIAASVNFDPPLASVAMETLQAVPTWMAGHAKALIVFERPFWREAGLSGGAMSRRGPLAEIHDASPKQGGPSALFGFVGLPPAHRQDEQALKAAILAQLRKLFGEQASSPIALIVKDWALDMNTATHRDTEQLRAHPVYGTPLALQNLWNGKLQFAATEFAPHFGGFAEGAIEAAENSFAAFAGQFAR